MNPDSSAYNKGMSKSPLEEDAVYGQRVSARDELGSVVGAPEEDDSIQFLQTQMQSIHEETVAKEQHETKLSSQLGQLRQFSNCSDDTNVQVSINTIKPKPKSRTTRSLKKPKSKKQSMNSMVRDQFESDKLSYFTGDQKKIDRFIKAIKNEEELDKVIPIGSTSQLITKTDWAYFLRSIKLKFPNLRTSRKRSLKLITRNMALLERSESDGLWSQASTMPETELSNEEIKWLYDLHDDEIESTSSFIEDDVNDNVFVLTLSQNMDSQRQPPEISDSEQFFHSAKSTASNSQSLEIFSEEVNNGADIVVISDSESEAEQLTISDSKSATCSQSQVQSGQAFIQVQESIYKPDIDLHSHQKELDPLISFQSFPFADSKRRTFMSQDTPNPIQVISSSTGKSPSVPSSPPQHKRKIIEVSPFKTPTKRAKLLNNAMSPNVSPIKMIPISSETTPEHTLPNNADEEIIISDVESIYSSARSTIYSNQLQEQASPLKRRHYRDTSKKQLHTTRHEVKHQIPIRDFEDKDNHIWLKKVGVKENQVIDIEEIIPDSEDDEEPQEVSIIEITKAVDEPDRSNASILQVPSSPSGELFSSQEIRKFLADQEDEAVDFNTFTTSQLMEQLKDWGMKPIRGRDQMIQILTEANKLTINSQTTAETTTSTRMPSIKISPTQQIMYENLSGIIKSNEYWYEKIISFEPLILPEMKDWLESIGYKLEFDFLQKYCDENGICCTNQRYTN
ncbi:uncharacterized protein RJT21DRAFT_113342 [Scheffersomyces amazonensis]|uniref:uncharacterized protein n=1 Tax=Scheffersomyces amazonensis TaxID=1078765 RepID=UPI00315D600C